MGLLALVRDPDRPGELMNIEIEDCWFIETNNRVVTYHHQNGKSYEAVYRLDDLKESTDLRRKKILEMHNSNFVNIPTIKHFDKVEGVVYFESECNEISKKAKIARKNFTLIEHETNNQK